MLARPVRMVARFFLTDSMDLPIRSSASMVIISTSSLAIGREVEVWVLYVVDEVE